MNSIAVELVEKESNESINQSICRSLVETGAAKTTNEKLNRVSDDKTKLRIPFSNPSTRLFIESIVLYL